LFLEKSSSFRYQNCRQQIPHLIDGSGQKAQNEV
jgi:hypothetical protein